jgi:hypothetical protein
MACRIRTCHGGVNTSESLNVFIIKVHDHPPNPDLCKKLYNTNNIRAKILESKECINSIISNELNKMSDDDLHVMPL